MGDKFKDIYRIGSARKPNWDYSWDGIYYVTICTGGRWLYLGDIVDEEMLFSEIGQKANEFWLEIPKHFGFVRLDEYQIMPNHIHGLIEIDHNFVKDENNSDNKNVDRSPVETTNLGVSGKHKDKIDTTKLKAISTNNKDETNEEKETSKLAVSTSSRLNDNRARTFAASKKWKSGTLGTIINQFKRAVTIDARKIDSEFHWQSRFHDSIITDQKSLDNIRSYIKNNPKNWAKNEQNPDNIKTKEQKIKTQE